MDSLSGMKSEVSKTIKQKQNVNIPTELLASDCVGMVNANMYSELRTRLTSTRTAKYQVGKKNTPNVRWQSGEEKLRVEQIVGNNLPSYLTYLYLASIIFNLGSEDLQDLSRRLPQQLNHRRQNSMDFHYIYTTHQSKRPRQI